MKQIIKLVILYLILVVVIVGIYSQTITDYKRQLQTTEIQIDGLNYLKRISLLTISIIKYMRGISYDVTKEELPHIHKDVTLYVENIYKHQNKTTKFINKDLNTQLELIKLFETSESECYKFLETINHENYVIGDKSKLVYVEDRELFLLGSLISHYMPEYLISSLLSHNIIEEFRYKNTLSNEKKNIFIEQTKLTFLSAEELNEIISLTKEYKNTQMLQTYIHHIKKDLKDIKALLPSIYRWKNNEKEVKEYIAISHRLLDFSHKLNDENHKIIELILKKKKNTLPLEIEQATNILYLILTLLSFIMYLYYRSHISNIEKDKEIKNINATLDKFVVFSKTDKNGVFTYVSSALEKLSGFSKDELIGNTPRLFKHPDTKLETYKEMWDTITAKTVYTGTLLNKKKDATSYWAQIIIIPELNKNTQIIAFSAYIQDVTNKKSLQEKTEELLSVNQKLEMLSTIDTLTQIYNRLKLDSILETYYKSYKRYKKIFSIIIIDIDYFKHVNDTYGHLVGDETLIAVVNIIKNNIRDTDIFGRWGGEEFMIVCEATDLNGTYYLAEKIRKDMERFEFKKIGKKTISLGVAQMEEELSINELITKADNALYEAKRSGRNKSVKG